MTLRLVSTRGEAPPVDIETAILSGLAPDGGLYVPDRWPQPDLSALDIGDGLPGFAADVLDYFTAGYFSRRDVHGLVREAFAQFDHPAVIPLVELREDLYLMELFWGPTLAFKDFALQVLSRLFDRALEHRGGTAMILGATSGDTGSAAMEAFSNRDAVDVVILFPDGRTTEVQRLQMTTIDALNVHAVAVDGTFDDCQDLVKAVAADPTLREDLSLSTANSINFGRLMVQIVYYFWASLSLGGQVSFAVPSGNFGNVYSAYAATRMGLPVGHLIVGSNSNHVLHGFFHNRRLELNEVVPTLSPSMDIQIPSNLERLMFDLFEGDGARLRESMTQLRNDRSITVPLGASTEPFRSGWHDDQATLDIMSEVHDTFGIIIDPHTAVGIGTALDMNVSGPTVCLATAHPAKFPGAVSRALGQPAPAPAILTDLARRPERVTRIPDDPDALIRLLYRFSRFA